MTDNSNPSTLFDLDPSAFVRPTRAANSHGKTSHMTPAYSAAVRLVRPLFQAEVDQGNGRCGRCGRPIPPGTAFHVGHIQDVALLLAAGWDEQAIHDPQNLRPEHVKCNTSAGGRLSQAMAAHSRTGIDLRHFNW